jgi:O-antigen/teichoic acid export membrane protein
MENSFFRFIQRDENVDTDKDHEKRIFSNSYFTIVAFSFLNSIIIFMLSEEISASMSDYSISASLIKFSALIPVLDALVLIPFAYLRSTRQAKKFAILRFVSISINVLANLYFITQTDFGVYGVIYANIISSGIAFSVFLPLIFKQFIFKINWKLIGQMFAFGLPTLPASLAAIALQVAGRQIMEYLGTTKDLALFGMNYRLGIPMMIFVSMFEYAWKPFYLSHYRDSDAKELFAKVYTYFTLAAMFLILFWTFSIDFIVRMPFIGGTFVNEVYWVGLPIIPIILWAYYFNGAFTNFNAGFLIEKKTKYLPLIVGIAAIVNITINILAIPKYKIYGAAWATFISYFVEAVVIYYFTLKVYPIKYEWNKVFRIILLSATILIIDRFILTFHLDLYIIALVRFVLLIIFILGLTQLKIINRREFSFIKRFINKN